MLAGEDGFPRLRVDCYAGYRGDEAPRRFTIGKSWIEIDQILDFWLGPDHRYFKVKDTEDNLYILRHDEAESRWELTQFIAARS